MWFPSPYNQRHCISDYYPSNLFDSIQMHSIIREKLELYLNCINLRFCDAYQCGKPGGGCNAGAVFTALDAPGASTSAAAGEEALFRDSSGFLGAEERVSRWVDLAKDNVEVDMEVVVAVLGGKGIVSWRGGADTGRSGERTDMAGANGGGGIKNESKHQGEEGGDARGWRRYAMLRGRAAVVRWRVVVMVRGDWV